MVLYKNQLRGCEQLEFLALMSFRTNVRNLDLRNHEISRCARYDSNYDMFGKLSQPSFIKSHLLAIIADNTLPMQFIQHPCTKKKGGVVHLYISDPENMVR